MEMKVEKPPSAMLRPAPVVLLSCIDKAEQPNVITLAAVGIACTKPPIISIAITPHKFSHKMVSESKEFVVNLPGEDLLWATDLAGNISGRDYNKFSETKLTPEPAKYIKAPLIKECPINFECKVTEIVHCGIHDLFLGEVVGLHFDDSILTPEGNVDLSKLKPILYNQGEYWGIGKLLENRRFAVSEKYTKKKG
jgi:flavin reductase (DIM6/NTAB) family NADH-FMN oxidoreductase RutF